MERSITTSLKACERSNGCGERRGRPVKSKSDYLKSKKTFYICNFLRGVLNSVSSFWDSRETNESIKVYSNQEATSIFKWRLSRAKDRYRDTAIFESANFRYYECQLIRILWYVWKSETWNVIYRVSHLLLSSDVINVFISINTENLNPSIFPTTLPVSATNTRFRFLERTSYIEFCTPGSWQLYDASDSIESKCNVIE